MDIIYPIVYLFFFGLAISWLFQRGFATNNGIRKLNILPLGAWFFDLLESVADTEILVSVFPDTPIALAWLLFLLTTIKWLFAGSSIALILTGLVMALKMAFSEG